MPAKQSISAAVSALCDELARQQDANRGLLDVLKRVDGLLHETVLVNKWKPWGDLSRDIKAAIAKAEALHG